MRNFDRNWNQTKTQVPQEKRHTYSDQVRENPTSTTNDRFAPKTNTFQQNILQNYEMHENDTSNKYQGINRDSRDKDNRPNLKSRPNPNPNSSVSRDVSSNNSRPNSSVNSMRETLEIKPNQPNSGNYDRPHYYNAEKQSRGCTTIEDGVIIRPDNRAVNELDDTLKRKDSPPNFYIKSNKANVVPLGLKPYDTALRTGRSQEETPLEEPPLRFGFEKMYRMIDGKRVYFGERKSYDIEAENKQRNFYDEQQKKDREVDLENKTDLKKQPGKDPQDPQAKTTAAKKGKDFMKKSGGLKKSNGGLKKSDEGNKKDIPKLNIPKLTNLKKSGGSNGPETEPKKTPRETQVERQRTPKGDHQQIDKYKGKFQEKKETIDAGNEQSLTKNIPKKNMLESDLIPSPQAYADTIATKLDGMYQQKELVDNSTQCETDFSFLPQSLLNNVPTRPATIEKIDKQTELYIEKKDKQTELYIEKNDKHTQCEIDFISVLDEGIQVSEFEKLDEGIQVSDVQISEKNDKSHNIPFLNNASIDWSSQYQDKEVELKMVQEEKLTQQSKFKSMLESKDYAEKKSKEKDVDQLQQVQDMLKSNLYDPMIVMKVEDELKAGLGIDMFDSYKESMAQSNNHKNFNSLGTILEDKEDVYNSEIKFKEEVINKLESDKNKLEEELVQVRENARGQWKKIEGFEMSEQQLKANCLYYQKSLDKAGEQIKSLTGKLNNFETEALKKQTWNDSQNEALVIEKNELANKLDISEKSKMKLEDELQTLKAYDENSTGNDLEAKNLREENQIQKISSKNTTTMYKDKFLKIKNMLVKEGFILNEKDGELIGVNAERDLFQRQYFELKQLTKTKEESYQDFDKKNESLLKRQKDLILEKENMLEEQKDLKNDMDYFKQKYEETYITMTEYMFFNNLITDESDLLQKPPLPDRKSEPNSNFRKSSHCEEEIDVLNDKENQRYTYHK